GYNDECGATVDEVLEDNESSHGVIESLGESASPPLPLYAQPAWRLARLPAAHGMLLATVGLLPPVLREHFGLRFTRAHGLALQALAAASRASTPAMPQSLRAVGPSS